MLKADARRHGFVNQLVYVIKADGLKHFIDFFLIWPVVTIFEVFLKCLVFGHSLLNFNDSAYSITNKALKVFGKVTLLIKDRNNFLLKSGDGLSITIPVRH